MRRAATTIGDIAARVGVTLRTYFRYFPDEREVLFASADEMRDRITDSLSDSPAALPPLAAIVHAMATCEQMFYAREHQYLRRRDAIIATSAELQEREAHKLAAIAAVVAVTLVERGTDPADAHLVADLALAAFKQASRLWMDDPATAYAVQLDRAAARASRILTAQTPDLAEPRTAAS